MKCPTFERLIDYVDCRLPQVEAANLRSHIATGCPACGETREWYDRVRAVVASDDFVAPPQWVLNRAIRIFDRQLHRPRLAERIAHGIAALVFDSVARPALAGVRSTEMASRQLLYSVGDYSVGLRIAPSERTGADLEGQVLKESDPTFESVSSLRLEIARAGDVVFSSVTDEMGEFKVVGVERGVYDLRVELSEGSIIIPALPVSES